MRHSANKFERFSAKRSSERKSNSIMHSSNISDSAAFLIDKMLNPPNMQQSNPVKENTSLPPLSPRSRATKEPHKPSTENNGRNHASASGKTLRTAADSMQHDGDVDFCEDRSDNGTYIVGADPESEAARKKIDELFGVVRAAEQSVIADSVSRQLNGEHDNSRRSRASDKKPISRERQERINRLARRATSASRSSSSSRHDNSSGEHQPVTGSRGSRNSSCDRTSKPNYANRPRRSTSQSSRHSSARDQSENDTRSSRSSLHMENELNTNDNQISSHPSMKFNRAFALRRARLGLGEPSRIVPPASQIQNQENEPSHNHNTSQRGPQLNSTPSYRTSQQSTGSVNFSRDDGGRFSLRMRNHIGPNRISAGISDRPSQHNSVLEGLINRVTSGGNKPPNNPTQYRNFASKQNQQYSSAVSSTVPNQSSDEQETLSPSRYRTVIKSIRPPKKALSELDQDEGSPLGRLNYSAGNEHHESVFRYDSTSRAGSSGAGAIGGGGHTYSTLQLGALDSLVISAISSLSLKIRHSVCDVLIEQAKKLPDDNETRLVVEEILPQLVAPSSGPKSPTSIEEIDQSLYFDLAKTLKNLKKVEQMVDVINLISNQLTSSSPSPPSSSSIPLSNSTLHSMNQQKGIRSSDSAIAQRTSNSRNDLSPV